jgi:hypothetical protein
MVKRMQEQKKWDVEEDGRCQARRKNIRKRTRGLMSARILEQILVARREQVNRQEGKRARLEGKRERSLKRA